MSRRIRTYRDLEGEDRSGLAAQLRAQSERVEQRLATVGRVVAVASGKGGVGKSFTAAALAVTAAREGLATGLLDADLNGPTSRRFLGAPRAPRPPANGVARPVSGAAGVLLMSTDLLLEEGEPLAWREPPSESFVWRGAQERNVFREFLSDVDWGALDLLLVDLPPGSQRLADLYELVPDLSGIVAVTLPSGASRASVERSLTAARRRGIPLLGVVENMSGYACPGCGRTGPLYPGSAGEELASSFGAPLLGRIPFDPEAARLAESGALEELVERAPAGLAAAAAGRALLERLALAPKEAGEGAR